MENKELMCDEKNIHYNEINKVKKEALSFDEIMEMADMFKLFADSSRLKIICSILNNELCVCDLCEILELTQSNVSHQLQLLRTSKLVKYRKEGKSIFYSLSDGHIEHILSQGIEHIME